MTAANLYTKKALSAQTASQPSTAAPASSVTDRRAGDRFRQLGKLHDVIIL